MSRSKTASPDAAPREAYHHGTLRAALIDASEAVLAERGLEGFSLREVARRSGVSPAAPAHHFGDLQGLLHAVADQGFGELAQALEAGNKRGGIDPVARLREQGVGYVGFALRYPGRFGLMFRGDFHPQRPGPPEPITEGSEAGGAGHAFSVLEAGVRGVLDLPAHKPLNATQWQVLLATWSVVHGFAHLALAGQLAPFTPPGGQPGLLRDLVAPMLNRYVLGLRTRPAERDLPAKGR